jgi:GlpG protein
MRQIGTIANQSLAERFGNYLVVRGVANTIEPSQSGDWAVWVAHEDQLDQAQRELEEFNRNPDQPQYEAAIGQAAKILSQQEKLERKRRKNFIDVRTKLGQPQQWNTPLTWILIALCIAATAATNFGDLSYVASDWLYMTHIQVVGQFVEWLPGLPEIRHGQVWRLITPIFMHGSIWHILFNLFWLRDLGAMIELRRGTWFLLILMVVAAVASNLAQYAWDGTMFLGISGVVYALFGYVWGKSLTDPTSGIGIRRETAIIMIAWLFACMFHLIRGVANGAHVAGILMGLAFAYVPYWTRRLLR